MANKLKYCVIGGGGYLGYHIGKQLQKEGHRVCIFDRVKPNPVWAVQNTNSKSTASTSTSSTECTKNEDDENDVLSGFTFYQGDVCDQHQLIEAFKDIDCVIHTVSFGMSGLDQLPMFYDRVEDVNIKGTQNIIRACCIQNVSALVYTSTVNVVFGGQEIHGGNEDMPYYPLHKHQDHYSRTKSIAEQMVLMVEGKSLSNNANGIIRGARLRGGGRLRTCALRLSGLMGPGEQRHIKRLMNLLQKGFLCFRCSKNEGLVDFVSIQNAVDAHILAARALTDPNGKETVFWECPVVALRLTEVGESARTEISSVLARVAMSEEVLVGWRLIEGGQAYFISDGQPINSYDYISEILTGLGYNPLPKTNTPFFILWFFAFICELLPSFVWQKCSNFAQYALTRTEVHTAAVTHHFSIEKARRDLGYAPSKPNDVQEIVQWLRNAGFAAAARPHSTATTRKAAAEIETQAIKNQNSTSSCCFYERGRGKRWWIFPKLLFFVVLFALFVFIACLPR